MFPPLVRSKSNTILKSHDQNCLCIIGTTKKENAIVLNKISKELIPY